MISSPSFEERPNAIIPSQIFVSFFDVSQFFFSASTGASQVKTKTSYSRGVGANERRHTSPEVQTTTCRHPQAKQLPKAESDHLASSHHLSGGNNRFCHDQVDEMKLEQLLDVDEGSFKRTDRINTVLLSRHAATLQHVHAPVREVEKAVDVAVREPHRLPLGCLHAADPIIPGRLPRRRFIRARKKQLGDEGARR
eukprot:CAMPEP_0185777974 /NCGR_PEP_ID=MMETSP1174-20130828/91277_1 /TAXON_ID=35687 /ORGANISM="Dictyocha speculum, Strain CCMP1381" /LENGTH=195 /DNA_ID=CAMNT_0028466553 /DNA_START=154 /DNA_END=742 /DNA_ORIENTATION=-